jgi:hypothetical protein
MEAEMSDPMKLVLAEIAKLKDALNADQERLTDDLRAHLYDAISREDMDVLQHWIIVEGVAYDRRHGIPLDLHLVRPAWAVLH